jgi:iron complex outermembrane receptor protein
MKINKHAYRNRYLYSAALIALSVQSASMAVAAAARTDALEEITVFAQKRTENIQDVSISVTALSGDQVRSLGLTSASDLGLVTPGLMVWQFGNTSTVTIFNIRGISQNDFADHNEAPNAVYSDGAYMSFIGAIGAQMYDVERIEVLRGPQGTLFGRNSTGGLIQLINRRPTDKFEGYAELTYASYNQVKFEGAVGGPLSPTLFSRLSVSTNRQDGYIKNNIGKNGGNDEQYNGRLQFLWKPQANFSALLSLRASRVNNINAGGYDIKAAYHDPNNHGLIDFVPAGVPNPTCPAFFGIPAPAGQTDCWGYTKQGNDPLTASFNSGNLSRNYYGATLTLDWSASDIDFTWITDGQKINKKQAEDTDGSPIPVLTDFTHQDAKQFSSEFRASGVSGALRWTAGLYYLHIKGDYSVGIDSNLFAAHIRNDYSLKTNSEAVFGQIEYQMAEQLKLIAGLRYTWDQKDFNFGPSCSGFGCFFFVIPGSSQALGLVDSTKASDYNAKVGIDWHPANDLLLYAGVTRGTKAGGFSAPIIGLQSPGELPYGGEKLWNYEAGFKWTLPGGRTRLNADVFYYDYKNYQEYDNIALAQIITNRNAKVKGGEVELASSPLTGLNISLGVAVLDAKVHGIKLPDGTIADRTMPQSPSVSINGLVRQEWSVGVGYLALQGDFKYVTSTYFRSIDHPALREPGYAIANARVSFEPEERNWSLALFVKNIADKRYRVMAFDDLTVNGVVNSNYAPPRWFGVTGSVHW